MLILIASIKMDYLLNKFHSLIMIELVVEITDVEFNFCF